MKNRFAWLCLLAALGLSGCAKQEVGTVLVYEIDRSELDPNEQVDGEALVRAVERRLKYGWSSRGKAERMPDGRVRVDVYGYNADELSRVKLMLGHAGRLQFRILANPRDHADLIAMGRASKDRRIVDPENQQPPKIVARWVKSFGVVAKQMRQMPSVISRDDGADGCEVLVVEDSFNLTGEHLNRASADIDQSGRPCVRFGLDPAGSEKMLAITTLNLPDPATGFKRQMGVILDGALVTAPNLNSAIGAQGEITGNFTSAETEQIAAVLMTGPFPAPLKLVSETQNVP
jgi:SecD/SecF fusion protein